MIEDTKPKDKIFLRHGCTTKMAKHFKLTAATISNHLRCATGTSINTKIRLYALNQLNGRYLEE